MTQVKICGIMNLEAGLAAAAAGADFLGLIFAPGRRQVAPDMAKTIAQAVRVQKPDLQIVGVFVNHPVKEVNRLALDCHLDFVQLSGNESWDYCRRLKIPIIKALHISAKTNRHEIVDCLKTGLKVLGRDQIFLMDTQVQGSFGGTGRVFDWNLVKEFQSGNRIVVAGGLTPENVGHLIHENNPWGVDTSSGVETAGQKDVLKIQDFIHKAKSAGGRR